ncbi:MAG: nucleotidyltransferase domain-containing protein [Planctomycetes bacterium]|nr:nucleotidyltransferase domain-containing protein [Planctomycetota bacterium]
MNLQLINDRAVDLGRQALRSGTLPGRQPNQFLFVTISGAHLYGFPSHDSDIDLRGSHVLPMRELAGLKPVQETYESHGGEIEGIEVDCVTHDLAKYLGLLTKKNGYVLEQIFSPLVVHDDGRLQELRALARGAITRHVVHHYLGFFRTQEKLVLKDQAPTAKAVLYLFRVAMTGLHLLRSGEVEANLTTLNESIFKLPFIADLVARKLEGGECGRLSPLERDSLVDAARTLEAQLQPTADASALPDSVQNFDALDDFLVRLRMETLKSS